MLKKFFSLLVLLPTLCFAADFVEGKDYSVVASPQVESSSKVPTITEFFSFGCPWCYRIDAQVNEWVHKMGKSITFEQVPVVFKPDWQLYAQAYYTAKTLAMIEKLNPLLFKAIQEDKKPLNTKQAMVDFLVAHGLDKEIASSAFENSPTIEMRVSNGMALMANYQINAIPAFVINNKYKTDLQMAGSPERLLEILDYLAKQKA